MEVIGSLSAILGIVGIAGQALNGAIKLRGFFEDYSEASANIEKFIRGLNSLIQVISDVNSILEKLSDANSKSVPGFEVALTSLKIQLEDCSKDLERLLILARESYPDHALAKGEIVLRKISVAVKRKKLQQLFPEIESHKSSISLKLSVIARCLDFKHSEILQAVDRKLDSVMGLEEHTQMLIAENLVKFENFEVKSRRSDSQTSEYLARMESILHKQAEMIASIHGSIANSSLPSSDSQIQTSNIASSALNFASRPTSSRTHASSDHNPRFFNSESAIKADFLRDQVHHSSEEHPSMIPPPMNSTIYNKHAIEKPQEYVSNLSLQTFLFVAKSLPTSVVEYNSRLTFLQNHKSFNVLSSTQLERTEFEWNHNEEHQQWKEYFMEEHQTSVEAIAEVRHKCWVEGHNIEDLDFTFANIIGCDQYEVPIILASNWNTRFSRQKFSTPSARYHLGPLNSLSEDHTEGSSSQYPLRSNSSPIFRLWTFKHDRINTWMLQILLQCSPEKNYHRAMMEQFLPWNSLVRDPEWERLVMKFWHLDAAASIPIFNVPSTNGAVNSEGKIHSEKLSLRDGQIQHSRKGSITAVSTPISNSSSQYLETRDAELRKKFEDLDFPPDYDQNG